MQQRKNNNPVLWSDIPDIDVIRVEDTYYMISTTMHTMPGGVIFRSYDLVHWEIATYIFDTLDGTKEQKLEDKKGIYGKGMWAATFRYHEGMFYIIFVCNDTKKTYLYTSNDINGPWNKQYIDGFYHDCSLLFDDDGRIYLVHGNRSIHLVEMKKDLSGPLEGGIDKVILVDTEDYGLGFEGAHLYKIHGKYYIFLIHWLKKGSGRRVEACYKADQIDGEWIGGDVVDDDLGYHNKGVAQGCIVDTPEGKWYGMLFQDRDAVGRVPCIVPMQWVDDMPVFGVDGKIPAYVETKSTRPDYQYTPIITSDDFNYEFNQDGFVSLNLAWQWNHEPDATLWSVTERRGYLRLKTNDVRTNLVQARNTLTQRTLGPYCTGTIKLDGSKLNEGDYAGIAAFQSNYGFVALTKENGQYYIVMLGRSEQKLDENGWPERYDMNPGIEYARVEVPSPIVELRVCCNFDDSIDEADFYYMDEDTWVKIGVTLHMKYTLDHFMGYRFALAYFSTKISGGIADFDYFRFE